MRNGLRCDCAWPAFRREHQRAWCESAGDRRAFSGLQEDWLKYTLGDQNNGLHNLFSMNDSTELKAQIKQMLVENLMLKIGASEIGDDQPLFRTK